MKLQIESILEEGFKRQNDYLRILAKNTVSDFNTFQEVQDIVRRGVAPDIFNIGDQFVVEKLSSVTASKGTSTGITAAAVDADTFVSGFGEVKGGDYVFTYDGNSWRNESGKTVSLNTYGITTSGTAAAGDHVIVTETTTPLVFDVIDFDHDTPADSAYTHSMTLQMHDLFPTGMQFDAPEAIWYIDKETYPTGLAADTYHFTLPAGYDNAYGGGSTFNFTLTKAIPVGGQICFGWDWYKQASNCKITTYSTVGNPTALETVGVAAGESGTAMPALSTAAVTANTNCVQRMRFGSNNWSESAVRQWLNSDASSGWWTPQTVFDRPSSTITAGFLHGIDPAFLAVIGDVTKTTQKSVSDGYGLDTSTERFFLLSRPEVYMGAERGADGADGTVYAYYGAGYSDLTAPGTGEDTNRIKYRNGSVATYWRLRTSIIGSGHGVRGVRPPGDVANLDAYDTTGVAPACVIV